MEKREEKRNFYREESAKLIQEYKPTFERFLQAVQKDRERLNILSDIEKKGLGIKVTAQ